MIRPNFRIHDLPEGPPAGADEPKTASPPWEVLASFNEPMIVGAWVPCREGPPAAPGVALPAAAALPLDRLDQLAATIEKLRVAGDGAAAGERLLNKDDLAEKLRMSARTVAHWDAAGKLPEPVSRDGALKWLASEIDDWLQHGMPSRVAWDQIRAAREERPRRRTT